jgi:hypothetical protein
LALITHFVTYCTFYTAHRTLLTLDGHHSTFIIHCKSGLGDAVPQAQQLAYRVVTRVGIEYERDWADKVGVQVQRNVT